MLRLFVVLLSVVFAGCFEMNNVTKEDVSDMADCYETTIAVDDRYAIVLNKDCMDSLLLSAAPKIALETEAIVNAEEVGETAAEATETEVATEYPCPIEDRGNWTLLVTLKRNNFNLTNFRVPKEQEDLINQAYVDGKDFFFIIYKLAVAILPTHWSDATRTLGDIRQARYYLEAPGLLNQNSLISHQQVFNFVDPDAFWFEHWSSRDRTQSGFLVSFETMVKQETLPNDEEIQDYVFLTSIWDHYGWFACWRRGRTGNQRISPTRHLCSVKGVS